MSNSNLVVLLMQFSSFFLLNSCQSGKSEMEMISNDPALIQEGEQIFALDCGPCHNFKQEGIGPNLAGITYEVPIDWIQRFIRNSQALIDGGDERAQTLFQRYRIYMPAFGKYTDDQMDRIIAYLHTFEKLPGIDTSIIPGLVNPIEEPIQHSGVMVNIEPFVEIPFSSEDMPRTRIVKMDHMPGSDRLFVADLRGQFYEIVNQKPVLVLELNKIQERFISKPGLATGFGSFAFHPDFLKNGLLYITHTEPPGSAVADFAYDDSIKVTLQWVLSEFKVDQPSAASFTGVSRELFRIDMVTGIHGMQEIAFKPNIQPDDQDYGKLFIGIGDGGSAENGYVFLADHPRTAWSKILCIDPLGSNSNNGRYGIPTDNPFVNNSKALPEVYAYGFRNPHRITWDSRGRMLATGIGHRQIEEINHILPGRNYGWPYREGTFVLNPLISMVHVFTLPGEDDTEYTYPVAQYDHDEGNAISGGYEVVSADIPELQGKYIFGDIVSGRLFFVQCDDLVLGNQAEILEWSLSINGNPVTLKELAGPTRVDLRFGKDAQNHMFIMTKADGKIYRLGGPNSHL